VLCGFTSPYRGDALAVADLLGGRVQAYFSTLATSIEYNRAAKLRALAVTAASRAAALPDIPTEGDFVPDYETSIWVGFGAPRTTPAEIIDRLNIETANNEGT
jgi:tripartite-type tricarboxylate transporter receptor subunit TctC